MTDEDRKRAAQAVLEVPFFLDLMNEIEQVAVNHCVNAKYNDHEARQAYAADVRSIRKIRSMLEAIAQHGQSETGKKAPA